MIPIPPAVAEAGRTVGPLWQFLDAWRACLVDLDPGPWWRRD